MPQRMTTMVAAGLLKRFARQVLLGLPGEC